MCFFVTTCFCESVEESGSFGANIYSDKHIQVSGLSDNSHYRNYYTRGNPLSSNLFIENGHFLASFNAVFQIPIFMGTHWVSNPTQDELPMYSVINLINGEVGFRFSQFDVGIVNTFNFYFTRSTYHESGVVLRHVLGNFNEISFAVLEEDRWSDKMPKLVVQFGYDFSFKTEQPNAL